MLFALCKVQVPGLRKPVFQSVQICVIYSAFVSVNPVTDFAPAWKSSRAQVSSVVPVVTTSSTSSMDFPLRKDGLRAKKEFVRLVVLCLPERPVWGTVFFVLTRLCEQSDNEAIPDIIAAISSA